MRKAFFLVLVLCLAAASCAVNPVTGKKELSLISEEQEIALGQQTDVEIRQQYGVYGDFGLNNYVHSVGKTLGPYTHRPQLDYHFAVLDTPVVNAFAVPGGYIYVTRGILALMTSEAELAVVLSHELGHVNARHSIKRMSEMMLVQTGLAIGGAVSKTLADISGLASVGIQLLFLKYSRDDERQADALGVAYARKGNYNPAEMITFFDSLEKYGDLSGKGRALPGFLSTHPLTSERIQNVKLMLTEADQGLETKSQTYLRRLDGLVYGDDPRQGYVEAQTFYHPEMAFSFSVPSGWTLNNMPSQVVMVSKDERAAIILQAEKTADNLADYAKKRASEIKGSELVGEDRLTVRGLSSFHQLYNVFQENAETLRMRLSLIRKGVYIYTFSALAPVSGFRNYDPDFRRSTQSFAELKGTSSLRRNPLRVRIIEANGRQSLQEIFADKGIKKEMWPTVALMNGMGLETKPASGQLVKVVH